MTWFHVSVVGNIVFGIIVALFVLDRRNFAGKIDALREHIETLISNIRKIDELRHNPIDASIDRIEAGIEAMREEMKKDLQRVWEAIDRLRER